MQALFFDSGRASVRRMSAPRPRRGFALIRVIASGICNTDLELLRGYHGFRGVPGHEFVGRVEGPRSTPWLGKRVVGEINLACGRASCAWCRQGWGRHCPRRTVLGILRHPGAHAEWLTLPEANLHEVPPEISDEEAVFTEPLAAACEILDQVPVTTTSAGRCPALRDGQRPALVWPAGMRAAVLGPGKLGRLAAQVLETAGAEVLLLGRHDRAPRAAFDLVVEATGSPEGMPRALELVRPRGTVVWKSTFHGPARFDAAPLVVNEVTVIGSRCGRFEPALELLRAGRVKVQPLISAEFPLARAPHALREAAGPGVLKVLLRNKT